MRKGEVTPKIFVLSFIIFTILVMGGVTIMSELSRVDADFINSPEVVSFNRTFNRYNEMVSAGEDLESSVTNAEPNPTLFGVLDGLLNSAWLTIKSVFSTFDFIAVAFGGISSVFGLPAWVGALITTLIIVMFAFSIYSLIFQGKT